MESFVKTLNGWIPLIVFTKNFVLHVWLVSEYASDYPKFFLIIISWGCHFESSKNLSNVISISFKYLEQKFLFRCNRIIFQTCSNLTMRNLNDVNKVVLASVSLTWDMLTFVSTVSTSENNHQANTVAKDIVRKDCCSDF